MKLTIFGATGGTGKQLVEQALAAGNYVVAYVRNPSKLNIRHGKTLIASMLKRALLAFSLELLTD